MINLYQEVSTNYTGSEDNIESTYYHNKNIESIYHHNKNTKEDIYDLIQHLEQLISGKIENSSGPNQTITMQTIIDDNINSSEKHLVPLIDIIDMNYFTNQVIYNNTNPEILMPDDPLAKLYLASLSVIGLLILYRLMMKF